MTEHHSTAGTKARRDQHQQGIGTSKSRPTPGTYHV